MISTLTKTLKAEVIKIKRSNILTLGTILGILLPIAFITANLFEGEYAMKPVNNGILYFNSLFTSLLEAFTGFFLPLLIIITASKIAQLDHKNKGWQLMETQPISKFAIFFSKYLILIYNVLKSIILYAIAIIVFGWVYSIFYNIHENYSMHIDIEFIIYASFRVFISTLAVIALQYVISIIISNFIWSLVLGFAMLLGQLLLDDAGISLRWFPYNSLLVSGANPSGGQIGDFILKAEWLSIVYSIVFLFIGFNWYRYKGFFNAFLKKPKRFIISISVLIIAISLSHFLIRTVTTESFEKTVVKGKLNTDKSISSVLMIEPITEDTIAQIPVTDNTFRMEYENELPANYYYFIFGNYHRDKIFMSSNDSIRLIYKQYGNNSGNVYVTGTRITENQQVYYNGDWSYVGTMLDRNTRLDEPEFYIKQIIRDYKNDLSKLSSKISVDHIVARDDFLNISKQLIAVRYANYWNSYLKKKELYHPDVVIAKNNQIEDLLSYIDLNNESLLNNNIFIDYITKELIKHKKDSISNRLDLIADKESSNFKDKWLFASLIAELEAETSNEKRDSIYNLYKSEISNERFVELANFKRQQFNKLNIGQPAIDFASYNASGKNYNLSDFEGKFIMLDTWASWCGPCKYQEPFYVRKYQKYKEQNIIFASVNVDIKESSWSEDLVEMNSDILQIRAKNIDSFMDSYCINSIPRFILIAPDGTIANSEFTFPSNKNFDVLLDAALEKNYDL
ncbi:thiol:disulfide interchange protein [Nonlabens ulvanivorans]|nr:thioredoxin-like domain-containing protein [Nonlabens ulvanivorans]GAK89080.1 thiol:disulfide interchange protein [Nonlabens ulvanivorans]